jgi:hypothetical protein
MAASLWVSPSRASLSFALFGEGSREKGLDISSLLPRVVSKDRMNIPLEGGVERLGMEMGGKSEGQKKNRQKREGGLL